MAELTRDKAILQNINATNRHDPACRSSVRLQAALAIASVSQTVRAAVTHGRRRTHSTSARASTVSSTSPPFATACAIAGKTGDPVSAVSRPQTTPSSAMKRKK